MVAPEMATQKVLTVLKILKDGVKKDLKDIIKLPYTHIAIVWLHAARVLRVRGRAYIPVLRN